MPKQRIVTLFVSFVLAAILGAALFWAGFFWDKIIIYSLHALLAAFFFAVLVSNQQFAEDLIAKIERGLSAVLFSYIIFFQIVYAPLARYIFGSLISQKIFFTDFLALALFLLFFFLFIVLAMATDSYAKMGFFSGWTLINSKTAYFALRNLWLAGVLLAVFLYFQEPFIIITVR